MYSALLLTLSILISSGRARLIPSFVALEGSPPSRAIVIGFVGGFVRHNDLVHSVVQIAARLRKECAPDTVVETFENRNGEKAYREILTLLDSNHDGTLSVEEKRNARIVLYGHSWGASESITVARRLEKDGIPVLLTVQVDSIAKVGEEDQIIPANVAEAANFYQKDGLLHGEPQIRPADTARTRILGNFRFTYAGGIYNCTDYPWYARIFMKTHTQIECDPKVWNQVESLIRSHLPPPAKD
jgi:hypothetical protein